MDWIGDAISGAFAGIMNGILDWFKGIVAGFAGTCIDAMNDFLHTASASDIFTMHLSNPALKQMCDVAWSVCQNVAMPIGFGLLGIMVALELANVSRNISTQNSLSFFESLARFVIKLMVWTTFISYTPSLMNMIYEFVRNISAGVKQFAVFEGSSGQITSFSIDKQPILDVINGIQGDQFLWLVFAMLFLIIALLLTAGATIFVQIVALARFLEIFVLFSLSAIPLVSFVNHNTRFIGQGYLTWFVSACLQGTVLVLLLAFFGPLFTAGASILGASIGGDGGSSVAGLVNALAQPLVFSIVMILSIQHSREWASKIVGAN